MSDHLDPDGKLEALALLCEIKLRWGALVACLDAAEGVLGSG